MHCFPKLRVAEYKYLYSNPPGVVSAILAVSFELAVIKTLDPVFCYKMRFRVGLNADVSSQSFTAVSALGLLRSLDSMARGTKDPNSSHITNRDA